MFHKCHLKYQSPRQKLIRSYYKVPFKFKTLLLFFYKTICLLKNHFIKSYDSSLKTNKILNIKISYLKQNIAKSMFVPNLLNFVPNNETSTFKFHRFCFQ